MSDRDHVRNTRRRVDGIRKNMQMVERELAVGTVENIIT